VYGGWGGAEEAGGQLALCPQVSDGPSPLHHGVEGRVEHLEQQHTQARAPDRK
jgi:hypothetical protein